MRFSFNTPGLMRFPPSDYAEPGANWEEALRPQDFQSIAAAADRSGFDAMTVPEHMVLPPALATQMGPYWPDAMTAMAFLAGATRRIRLRSGVIVLPYHPPIQLAKAAATLDVLSGGRLMLNFGIGMARGEFAALGVPFSDRGRVAEDYLAAMKALWTEETPAHRGPFIEFSDVVFEPKPVQQPHPPVWFGGRSIFAARRALRLGSGWAPDGAQGGTGPWLTSAEDLPSFLARAREDTGVDAGPFDIALPLAMTLIRPDHTVDPGKEDLRSSGAIIDRIGALAAAGVTWTTVPPVPELVPRSLDGFVEYLDWASEEVIAHFRNPVCPAR